MDLKTTKGILIAAKVQLPLKNRSNKTKGCFYEMYFTKPIMKLKFNPRVNNFGSISNNI